MNDSGWMRRLVSAYQSDPWFAVAVTAAEIALATTPLAFVILGRMNWFTARRGRVLQRPEFSSIVCAMLLVMGIPAIFLALALKSLHFDEDRYAFDPNKTWSVLEQGRGFKDVKEADEKVREEMKRLAEERKNLVDTVKKLDESMLALRAAAASAPAVGQKLPEVLQRLAKLRASVGLDGPQQLMDFTAPPADLVASAAPKAASGVAPVAAAVVPTAIGQGLSKAQVEAEITAVPAPQKPIAAMLPLLDLPQGWEVGKSGEHYVETFNAENLFEKIDGRAESFVDYKVKGMAYTYFHPVGDDSNEVQVYLFELGDALKALGKYGTEKPEAVKPLEVGDEGYTSAGSTLFHSGPYYTQIVSTKDDKAFADFAVTIARRIAGAQKSSGASPSAGSAPVAPGDAPATPQGLFALLPSVSGKTSPTYVPADVFGYSFLSEVFMAEYSDKGSTWKGFLRPYANPAEARAVFDKYLASAKQDGAEIKEETVDGADKFVVTSNIGLTDALFLKGNSLGGAAGATDGKPAAEFARAFAKTLPVKVPVIPAGKEE